MPKQYSIAQARDHLPGIVHEVERGAAVELTRRGRPVAVILSRQEYERLTGKEVGFGEALEAFRRKHDIAALDITPDIFPGPRDRSPGREFEW